MYLVSGDAKYGGIVAQRLKEEGLEAQVREQPCRAEAAVNVVVTKNALLKEITARLHGKNIGEVFVFPYDTHTLSADVPVLSQLIPAQVGKPRLAYVEIELTSYCNLNCKGCCNFCNINEDRKKADIEVFTRDLTRLKELFWGIGKIRLMGGEPLLNPDYPDFARIAREIFPDSDLRIVSNGLLIPKQSDEKLRELRKYDCTFDISNYPPTQKDFPEIKKKLDSLGIEYHLGPPMKIFLKNLLDKPNRSAETSYRNCLFSYCHALDNGYISGCSFQMFTQRLNKKYSLSYPENARENIYEITDGWQLDEILSSSHEFCRYCSSGTVPFRWQVCRAADAKPSDWIAENNFYTSRFMPLCMGVIAPAADKLRKILQKHK